MSAVPAPPEAMDAEGFRAAAGATDQQMADLQRFRDLLEEWNGKMNLVGPSALSAFWQRHAWDSAQLLKHASDAKTWADLGAGAGFPGVVLAIMLKGVPGAKVHLVESMAKRCRFLSEVVAELGLPAQVHNARAEEVNLTVDIVTSRACAPLVRLLGYARPYLKRGARGLFLKGQDVVAEIEEATKSWRFSSKLLASLSDPSGRVLVVEGSTVARA